MATIMVGWLLCAHSVVVGATQPEDQDALIERARTMAKEGADRHEIMAIVEPPAYDGNPRAQLLLSTLHFEGKGIPRNVVEGYAWLQVASTTAYPKVADHAKDMMRANEPALSGSELIQADKRAASISSVIAQRRHDRYASGLRNFTTERPVDYGDVIDFGPDVVQLPPEPPEKSSSFRVSCAASRLCAQLRSIEEPRCTGRIVRSDTSPTMREADGAHIFMPDYPLGYRRKGVSGSVLVIAHVDRSGWICGAATASSSGEPSLDEAAIAAVTLWRLVPAKLRGESVEVLKMLYVSFNVRD